MCVRYCSEFGCGFAGASGALMVELWVTDLKWVFLFLLKNYSGTVMWIHSTRTLLMSLSSEKCGNASCFLHELCV